MKHIQQAFFGLAWDICNCAHYVARQQQVKGNEAVGYRYIHIPAEPFTTKQQLECLGKRLRRGRTKREVWMNRKASSKIL